MTHCRSNALCRVALFIAIFLAVKASAQIRSGANAQILAEALLAGGDRASSSNVVNDATLGDVGAFASGTDSVLKPGFSGALYDVTSLTIFPATDLPEAAQRMLFASAVLDDATVLSLANTAVTWTAVSGPVSVSSAGLLTSSNVFTNTSATAGAAHSGRVGSINFLVLNVGNDDFGSYATDGLPDDWQVRYFGVGNANAAPTADLDGDGQNNRWEYFAGTVPTNAASRFSLNVARQGTAAVLTFSPWTTNRSYSAVFNTNLAFTNFAPLSAVAMSNQNRGVITDSNGAAAQRFYRVRITEP